MGEEEGKSGDIEKESHVKKERKKRQKLLIIDLFLDFAKNTTLHGLRYITQVGLTVVEKTFWILTFLISVILCFILIERVWYKWMYSPVIVAFNEKMIPVSDIPFPSITICPQWKCKVSAYNYTQKFVTYRKKYSNESKIDKETYEVERELLEDAYLVCDIDMPLPLTSRNTSNETLVKNLKRMAPSINEASSELCLWRGQWIEKCIKEVLTSEGVCFNFNALSYNDIFRNESIQSDYKYLDSDTPINKWNIVSGYNNTEDGTEEYPRRGQENGAYPDLTVFLKENTSDVDEVCNNYFSGWKIYLQHPADMPQASMYYYAVDYDQVVSLALKISILNTSESLMGYTPEQRQCYFPNENKLIYFSTYTPDNCRLECLSRFIYKECNCVWYHMPHHNSSELCTTLKRQCVEDAQNRLASTKQKECHCLPSCDSVHYDAEVLKSKFDSKRIARALYNTYKFNSSETIKEARLEVYFKEPSFVSMHRSELFGITDFLANCGGLLGLFLGFSFLSLIEIFYFCTLRLWCTLKKDIVIEKRTLTESLHKK